MWLQHSPTLSHTKVSTKSISRLKYTSDFHHEVDAYGVRDEIYFDMINTSLFDEQSVIFLPFGPTLGCWVVSPEPCQERQLSLLPQMKRWLVAITHLTVGKMLYLARLFAF